MATDTELRRRVTRLENETDSIYELITELKTTQAQHTERFDGIDQRFDGIDTTLSELTSNLNEIASNVNELVRRLPEPS